MSSKRSRVHPPYKTKYRVTNWATYNRALVDRGSLGLWISPDAIASWNAKPSDPRRGGQPKYSNLAIESALTLGLVYHLPLRHPQSDVRARSPEVRRDQGLNRALDPSGRLEIDSCNNASRMPVFTQFSAYQVPRPAPWRVRCRAFVNRLR